MKIKLVRILKRLYYGNKWLISVYNYNQLIKKEQIYIHAPIKRRKIKYLNCLKKDCKIEFTHNNYENIFECIKFLLENDYTNIIIIVRNKKEFNNYINSHDISSCLRDNVFVNALVQTIPINKYLDYESILYNMVKSAQDLSPLEKYVYAYNIVKMFKKYKENNDDKSSARDLYKILDSDDIVCVGFSELLSDLLNKLNINNTTIHADVEVVDDTDELDIKTEKAGHQRVYVYLKDEKYKIEGYYLSDPTWDNDLENDFYTHILFKDKDKSVLRKYEWIDESLLFDVNCLYEFNKYFDFIKERFNKSTIDLMNYLIEIIFELEPGYLNDLKTKYDFIDKKYNRIYELEIKKKEIQKVLELKKELALHIIDRVNNPINEKSLWESIKVIYKKSYGFKNDRDMERELLKNKINYIDYQEYCFPEKYNKRRILRK